MHFANERLSMRSRRWITEILQAVLILGLPFLKIKGESALRFDIPTLKLHVFGTTLWMHEFFLVLVATIFLTLLTVFVTLMFGRVWCGWLCPQTVLVDLTPFMDRAKKRGRMYALAASAGTLVISVIVAASLIWYFVSPYEFIPSLIQGTLGGITWGFWIVLTVILFLNFALLRHKWCATVCPYAKLQGVLFDRSTLIIEMDSSRKKDCINCLSCVRNCPTGMDIRKGLDAACINCAECIDACNHVMHKNGKPGLIRYAFGTGGGGPLLRQNVYIVGGFLLLFLIVGFHLALTRSSVDVTILPHAMEPRLTKDGRIINAYVLSIRNKLAAPVDLTVTVEQFDPTVIQSITAPIHLDAEAFDRFPLFVRANRTAGPSGTRRILVQVDNTAQDIHIRREANFTIPDEL